MTTMELDLFRLTGFEISIVLRAAGFFIGLLIIARTYTAFAKNKCSETTWDLVAATVITVLFLSLFIAAVGAHIRFESPTTNTELLGWLNMVLSAASLAGASVLAISWHPAKVDKEHCPQ